MRFPMLCSVSLFLALGQAKANITVYTNQALFDAAVAATNTTLKTINFNGQVTPGNFIVAGNGTSYSLDGATFTGSNLVLIDDAYGISPTFPILSDSHDPGLFTTSVPSSVGVSATLGDWVGTYGATITLSTGPTTYSFNLPQIPSTTFIGFVSSGPAITSFSILDLGGAQAGVALEEVQFTPEPGFYGMLALGFAGLTFAVSRRRAAKR